MSGERKENTPFSNSWLRNVSCLGKQPQLLEFKASCNEVPSTLRFFCQSNEFMVCCLEDPAWEKLPRRPISDFVFEYISKSSSVEIVPEEKEDNESFAEALDCEGGGELVYQGHAVTGVRLLGPRREDGSQESLEVRQLGLLDESYFWGRMKNLVGYLVRTIPERGDIRKLMGTPEYWQDFLQRSADGARKLQHNGKMYMVRRFMHRYREQAVFGRGQAKAQQAKESVNHVMLKELRNSRALWHPNIDRCYASVFDERTGTVILVQRWLCCSLGQLFESRVKLNIQENGYIFYSLLKAVHHMQELGRYHMDLNPDNILFTQNMVPVISGMQSIRHGSDIIPGCQSSRTVFELGRLMITLMSGGQEAPQKKQGSEKMSKERHWELVFKWFIHDKLQTLKSQQNVKEMLTDSTIFPQYFTHNPWQEMVPWWFSQAAEQQAQRLHSQSDLQQALLVDRLSKGGQARMEVIADMINCRLYSAESHRAHYYLNEQTYGQREKRDEHYLPRVEAVLQNGSTLQKEKELIKRILQEYHDRVKSFDQVKASHNSKLGKVVIKIQKNLAAMKKLFPSSPNSQLDLGYDSSEGEPEEAQ